MIVLIVSLVYIYNVRRRVLVEGPRTRYIVISYSFILLAFIEAIAYALIYGNIIDIFLIILSFILALIYPSLIIFHLRRVKKNLPFIFKADYKHYRDSIMKSGLIMYYFDRDEKTAIKFIRLFVPIDSIILIYLVTYLGLAITGNSYFTRLISLILTVVCMVLIVIVPIYTGKIQGELIDQYFRLRVKKLSMDSPSNPQTS